jgi:hypothetical protein
MSFTETIAAARAFAASGRPPSVAESGAVRNRARQRRRCVLGKHAGRRWYLADAVNRVAGARTQLAELVTAGATLLTMLLLAGPMGLMPQAAWRALSLFIRLA